MRSSRLLHNQQSEIATCAAHDALTAFMLFLHMTHGQHCCICNKIPSAKILYITMKVADSGSQMLPLSKERSKILYITMVSFSSLKGNKQNGQKMTKKLSILLDKQNRTGYITNNINNQPTQWSSQWMNNSVQTISSSLTTNDATLQSRQPSAFTANSVTRSQWTLSLEQWRLTTKSTKTT